MKISRAWAMPNAATFEIKPIRELIQRHIISPSIDPFSRGSGAADVTNDIDTSVPADEHLLAIDFIKRCNERGYFPMTVLFDPPYSLRQCKEHYVSAKKEFGKYESQNCIRWSDERNHIASMQPMGGKVLSFGWNSVCMGKKRGYEIIEILLVAHGPAHNDTICVVEEKIITQKAAHQPSSHPADSGGS